MLRLSGASPKRADRRRWIAMLLLAAPARTAAGGADGRQPRAADRDDQGSAQAHRIGPRSTVFGPLAGVVVSNHVCAISPVQDARAMPGSSSSVLHWSAPARCTPPRLHRRCRHRTRRFLTCAMPRRSSRRSRLSGSSDARRTARRSTRVVATSRARRAADDVGHRPRG